MQSTRNTSVEQAVASIISRIDDFISGTKIQLPQKEYRLACDELLATGSSSVKLASLFLSFYRLQLPDWDLNSVPVGIRGQYGDKALSEALNLRGITLHNSITAFGENLGWKGNVRNVQLSADPRFSTFLKKIADAPIEQRKLIADYFAQQFAASQVVHEPLPPIGANMLTFVRAKELLFRLIELQTEGHVQQFLIAGLLSAVRNRSGIEVRTHHPHAADTFDGTAGDIEEYLNDELLRAYEVTVRDDWKNRISNFQHKMDKFKLVKYVIIAPHINADSTWSSPAKMALALEPYGRDIAVIDIKDVCTYLAAELSASELREAVNACYAFLSNPRLCGREDFKLAYREAVGDWLE